MINFDFSGKTYVVTGAGRGKWNFELAFCLWLSFFGEEEFEDLFRRIVVVSVN